MKYKVTNKTFSPMIFNEIGAIPARGSVVVYDVPEKLRIMQRNNKIEIKEIKESIALKDKKLDNKKTKEK